MTWLLRPWLDFGTLARLSPSRFFFLHTYKHIHALILSLSLSLSLSNTHTHTHTHTQVGKASPTEGTLPGSIYFILKYKGDIAAAMNANAMVFYFFFFIFFPFLLLPQVQERLYGWGVTKRRGQLQFAN